jgi:hypothetical protein
MASTVAAAAPAIKGKLIGVVFQKRPPALPRLDSPW